MKKYILLFLPLIVFGLLVLGFFIFEPLFYEVRDKWMCAGFAVAAWGGIQALFLYKRSYKKRHRLLLALCIVFGTATPAYIILANNNERWFTIPLALAANCAFILYLLRHKKAIYSLASGWAQLKRIGITGSLLGWAVFGLVIVDAAINREGLMRAILPQTYYLEYLTIPWGLTSAVGIVSYYVEEILHQKRSTGDEWQKQIDTIGGNKE